MTFCFVGEEGFEPGDATIKSGCLIRLGKPQARRVRPRQASGETGRLATL